MSIETGIYAVLTGDAGVSALVGTRIYPLVVPQDASLPAIAYQRVSGGPTYTQDGDANLTPARFQFTCLGSSYSQAKAVATAVRAAISGASGTWDDVTVGACLVETDQDGWAEAFQSPVVRLDARIWYSD